MYKLTVIAGPNRGTSFAVQSGENSIGRQSGNQIVLPSSKVSKKHCTLVVDNGEVLVKDQGSSNGTFVNGILTKLRKIRSGDRISVGEFVLELTEPVSRALVPSVPNAFGNNVVQLQFPGGSQPPQSSAVGAFPGAPDLAADSKQMPKDLKGKLLWEFENRVMPIFYGLNLKNEWRILAAVLFGVLLVGNVVISVYPLLESNRITVIKETGRRATFMARDIADRNAPFLAQRAETRTEIGSPETAEGVRVSVLTDMDNRIIAPSAKLNTYLTSGPEASLAVRARDQFRNGRETGYVVESDGIVIAVEPVKVLNTQLGKNVVVGMAVVSIDGSLATPDFGEMGMVYSETLILTSLLGGLILLILYRMTLKPFQVLNEDMDRVLKGDMSQVTHEFKFDELNALWDIINSALQRVPRGGSPGSGIADSGGYGVSAEDLAGPLRMIGNFAKFGLVIFDQDKKILFLNSIFEEISGIRNDNSIGQEFSSVARDQSMAAFVTDLLSRAPAGGEGVSEDYDFSGISYKCYAAAFGSSGSGATAYIMAAVRVEG